MATSRPIYLEGVQGCNPRLYQLGCVNNNRFWYLYDTSFIYIYIYIQCVHDIIDNMFIAISESTVHTMYDDFRDILSLNGLCKFYLISSYYF